MFNGAANTTFLDAPLPKLRNRLISSEILKRKTIFCFVSPDKLKEKKEKKNKLKILKKISVNFFSRFMDSGQMFLFFYGLQFLSQKSRKQTLVNTISCDIKKRIIIIKINI